LRGEHAVPIYKFQIGETVFLNPSYNFNIPGGACTVTKKLPERDGEYEYRVRSVNEPESDLSGAP
jgi:hypothetical protein